jgi:hypothetical protein
VTNSESHFTAPTASNKPKEKPSDTSAGAPDKPRPDFPLFVHATGRPDNFAKLR